MNRSSGYYKNYDGTRDADGSEYVIVDFCNQQYQKNRSSFYDNLKVGYPSQSSRFGVNAKQKYPGLNLWHVRGVSVGPELKEISMAEIKKKENT